jgi:hypothetical protein
MTVAQAATPIADVPSEVRPQWIQHQTLEISAFIAPGTKLIIAAFSRLLCCVRPCELRLFDSIFCSSESRYCVLSQVAGLKPLETKPYVCSAFRGYV